MRIYGRDLAIGDVLVNPFGGGDLRVDSFEARRTEHLNARVALCGRLQFAIVDDAAIQVVGPDESGAAS